MGSLRGNGACGVVGLGAFSHAAGEVEDGGRHWCANGVVWLVAVKVAQVG